MNWQMGRGGLAAVHYILRLPSGVEYRYKGYPDFIVSHRFRFSRAERHLGLQGREEKVRGVGEVQSQRGSSVAVKTRALAQAGIYTIGHFVNSKQITGLATLILYKDLTTHVVLATINRESDHRERNQSEGKTDGMVVGKYKLVHAVHPFNLKNAEDVAIFASVFIATLKTTM